jgi:predicted transposase/invertase (TIGR01784 family)
MKRDSIFYKLFRQSPTLLFELVPEVPEDASRYRFDSVAVKEPKFEIDGVLLPPEGSIGTVFFVEVQFQKVETLYERIFAETALYFYRNCEKFSDWQAVVIYPSRSTEQSKLHPHRSLLNSEQVHRIFLNELGNIRELPLWVALMVLTTVTETEAPEEARYLIERTEQVVSADETRAIIEMITTIISYKFKELTTREVEAMLDITFEETRVYREIKAEAEQKGLEKGRQEGRQEEAANLILRMLTKRFGLLAGDVQGSVTALSLENLEELSEALLDFDSLGELSEWIEQRP